MGLGQTYLSSSGAVCGPLWVETMGHAFPDDSWNDFPAVVLGWWGDAALRLECNPKVYFDWMDGPYRIVCTRSGQQEAVVEFKKRSTDINYHQETTKYFQIVEELCDNQCKLIEFCRSNTWMGEDIDNLIATYSLLSALRRRLESDRQKITAIP